MRMVYDKPPDGGWGWMVVLNGFLSYMVVWSTPRCFAILFSYWMNEFECNKSETSWIISLMTGFACIGSLPGSYLTIRIGGRRTVIIGGLLAFIGLFIISFSTSLQLAYIGSSICGLGFGFSYANATPQIGLYFDRKRALATSFSALGTPLTGILFPFILSYLVEEYGWRGAVLVFSAYSLHTSVGGCLLRPVHVKSLMEGKKEIATTGKILDTKLTEENNNVEVELKIPVVTEVKVKKIKSGMSGYLELLSNWRMVLFMIHGFLDFTYRVSTNWFIVFFCSQTFSDVTEKQSSWLLIYFSIFDSIGRPLSGYVSTFFPHKSVVNGIEILLTGLGQWGMSLCILMIPFSSSYALVATYMSIIGAINGLNGAYCFPINSRLNKSHQLPHAVGLFHFAAGVGLFVGSPFAGFLADTTGDMKIIFYFLSGVGFTTGSICVSLYFLCRKFGIRPKE